MASNDERLYYIRLSKAGFQGLTVKQSFLDARPLVKTEGTDEEPPNFYTEEDALTFGAAMRLYKPHSVALMQEGEGAPLNLGTLDEFAELPEEMTHAFFALNSPKMDSFEVADLVRQADSVGAPINHVLVPYGEDKDNYLTSGTLPS